MFAVFVANSSGKALARTRALLDSYAVRIGEQIWATPITVAALEEIRRALRRRASRHMSVACYRNAGRAGLRLEWIVGSQQHYDSYGRYAAQTQARRHGMPMAFRLAALLARLCGESHDLGKGTAQFQKKLNSAHVITDAIRHEWISAWLLWRMAQDGITLDAAMREWNAQKSLRWMPVDIGHGLSSAVDAALAVVTTHHYGLGYGGTARFPIKKLKASEIIGNDKHVRSKELMTQAAELSRFEGIGGEDWRHHGNRLRKLLDRLQSAQRPEGFWLGAAFIARAALFLADHEVSSRDVFAKKGELYANTARDKKGERRLNQELFWHLQEVGRQAANNVRLFANPDLPCLNDTARLLARPPDLGNRFRWQYEAADAMPNRPALVFNVASTGAGKTRANVMLAAALRGGRSVRITSAFNLRTLTLQTHKAYIRQLKFEPQECACLIGDEVVREVHAAIYDDLDSDTGAMRDLNLVGGEGLDIPVWIEGHLRQLFEGSSARARRIATMVAAPVLVCTIDFLNAAGDASCGNEDHAWALLRLMHSDLILDEIDSYDAESMVAVLRLVFVAAMLGRNVVVSSATLSATLAALAEKVWRHGTSIARQLGLIDQDPAVAIVSDKAGARVFDAGRPEFDRLYGEYMALVAGSSDTPTKVMTIAPVAKEDGGLEGFYSAILESSRNLHKQNAWDLDGRKVSVGLVRVANISACMEAAQHLLQAGLHVMTYHAREPLLRRAWKEMELDRILNRSRGDMALKDAMREHMKRFPDAGEDAIFVVVATPVEEVGRDHDFDWAVIEPSSAHSIVQTAGRVNRHRRVEVKVPNVAVLQRCRRDLQNRYTCVFTNPGNEAVIDDMRGTTTHATHDAAELLGLQPGQTRTLDAKLMFGDGRSKFAQFDEGAIAHMTQRVIDQHIIGEGSSGLAWFGSWFGAAYPLRENSRQDTYCIFCESPHSNPNLFKYARQAIRNGVEKWGWIEQSEFRCEESSPPNAWLSPSISEVIKSMNALLGRAIDKDDMTFSVYDNKNVITIDWRGVVAV